MDTIEFATFRYDTVEVENWLYAEQYCWQHWIMWAAKHFINLQNVSKVIIFGCAGLNGLAVFTNDGAYFHYQAAKRLALLPLGARSCAFFPGIMSIDNIRQQYL